MGGAHSGATEGQGRMGYARELLLETSLAWKRSSHSCDDGR